MKSIKFILIVGFILITRLYDYTSTYIFTHDLAKETNFLVTLANFEWSGMIIMLMLIIGCSIYGLAVSSFSSYNIYPDTPGLHYKEFITFIYLGYKGKWTELFYKTPDSFTRFIIIFGPIPAYSLVWAGMITTTMWLLINESAWYLINYHNPLIIYLFIIAGVLLVAQLRLYYLYKIYCRKVVCKKIAADKF